MNLTLKTLVLEYTSKDFSNRPWRFDGESLLSMKVIRTDSEMQGQIGVDLAPPLDAFTNFVGQLMHERLINANRGEIDDKYNRGLWADAWDGLFYDAAIETSSLLAEDERITLLPEYANALRFLEGLRVYVESGKVFFHASGKGGMTLPIATFQPPLEEVAVNELRYIFGTVGVDKAIAWLQEKWGGQISSREAAGSNRYDAFISHSSRDAGLARSIYDFLTANGKCAFLSEVSLQALGNAQYMKAIDIALEQSKHLMLVGSSIENIQSGWVEAEWRLFINEMRSGRKDGNFVTVVSPTLQPSSLPMALRYYEVVSISEGYLEHVLKYIN